MKPTRPEVRNLFVLAVCLGIFTLAMTVGVSKQNLTPPDSPQVDNKTASLEIVSVTQQDTLCTLTLRNISTKTINGYSIGRSNTAKLDVDLTIGDKTIAPGEEFKASVPVAASQGPPVIKVLAVLFTDGTGDGEARVVAANRERRQGTKQQLIHILPLLRVSVTSLTPAELSSLKKQVAALSAETEDNVSPQLKRGKLSANQDILGRLELMKQDGDNTRKELHALIRDIEERILRL